METYFQTDLSHCDIVENMHVLYFSYSLGLLDNTDGEFGLLYLTDRLTKKVLHSSRARCFFDLTHIRRLAATPDILSWRCLFPRQQSEHFS
jgi:hypothetical protein